MQIVFSLESLVFFFLNVLSKPFILLSFRKIIGLEVKIVFSINVFPSSFPVSCIYVVFFFF